MKGKRLTIISRRLVILVAGLLGCGAPVEGAGLQADMVVVNGNVITVEVDQPRVEAFAVKSGRFLAAGSTREIVPFAGDDTVVLDAKGKTVVPGFIDAHMHPDMIFPYKSIHHKIDLGPKSVATMEELIEALRKKAQVTPKGNWVRGQHYQDTKLGRHPTRWDLDKASMEHPIFIMHSSEHVAVVNSKALELAGVTEDSKAPPGGAFDKDHDGKLTGVCREGAMNRILRGETLLPPSENEEKELAAHAVPTITPPSRPEQVEALLLCFDNFLSKGITSVADAAASPSKLQLYQDALEQGLSVRVNLMMVNSCLPQLKELKLRTGFGSDRLKIGPIKIFHGNSTSGYTCWLSEPYDMLNPQTGKKDYYGIPPGRSQAELDELVFSAHEAGFQCAIHANGDREIAMVLDAYEKALQRLPRKDHRHRIEHCSVPTPELLERIKKLGVVLALHSYIYEHGDKMEVYGPKRWGMMHPNGTALKMGIPVAGNSDYPVSAADPLLRIQSMVTRKTAEGEVYGPEQKISVDEAIRVWTLGGAYAAFEEDIKGSIKVGKLADFVILSRDPTKVEPEKIKDIQVEKTVVGGKIKFERS